MPSTSHEVVLEIFSELVLVLFFSAKYSSDLDVYRLDLLCPILGPLLAGPFSTTSISLLDVFFQLLVVFEVFHLNLLAIRTATNWTSGRTIKNVLKSLARLPPPRTLRHALLSSDVKNGVWWGGWGGV